MYAVADWCVRHRRLVIAGWLVVLVLVTGLARMAGGSDYSQTLSLPGTDSNKALSLLTAASPKVSGDSEQVVFQAAAGRRVTDPAIRARVAAVLSEVAQVPHVTRVISPFTAGGAAQISPDHTVAYATVTLDQPPWDVPESVGEQLVHAVTSAGGHGLTIAMGGQVAENAEGGGLGATGTGIAAAAVVLALVFGSLFAALLPLLSALVSLGTAVGVVELLSHVMSVPQFSAELMPLIGLGVGIDYALFIVSRHRQGVRDGSDPEASILTAVNTSGRAVLFAGIVVCIAVLGMLTLGLTFFRGLAVATAIGVALTMATALTLLPALLAFIGPRVLSRRQRRRLASGTRQGRQGGFWTRWAAFVAHRPALPAIVALGLTLLVAAPFLSLRLGSSDSGSDPTAATTRQAYDMLARGFGPGFNGPLELVAVVHDPAQRMALGRLASAVAAQPGVAQVLPPRLTPAHGGGQLALVIAYPASSPQDAATTTLLDHLRETTIPDTVSGSGLHVYVGGTTALFADFGRVLTAKLPLLIGLIVALSFLLLAVVFRSVVVPLTAAVMNMLSVAAAFGILVALFQWTWLGTVIGITRAGPVESFLPVLLFAILFGLSMDYQIFLLTRIHEEWIRTGDNRTAVRHGIAASGRVITSAALIMIVVFGSFTLGDIRIVKEFGAGLAGGILIDAVVIRSAVVPALMLLLGRANWWLPRRLDHALPRVHVEAEPAGGRAGSGHPVIGTPEPLAAPAIGMPSAASPAERRRAESSP